GRVAKALLDLADRFGRPTADGLLVAHDLTQEELAQLVGASRETVNKALAEFVQRDWLRLGNRAVIVLDLQRLRQRARSIPTAEIKGRAEAFSVLARVVCCYNVNYSATLTIIATSTGAFIGNIATPTADRAWMPRSWKISPRNSDAPLSTTCC